MQVSLVPTIVCHYGGRPGFGKWLFSGPCLGINHSTHQNFEKLSPTKFFLTTSLFWYLRETFAYRFVWISWKWILKVRQYIAHSVISKWIIRKRWLIISKYIPNINSVFKYGMTIPHTCTVQSTRNNILACNLVAILYFTWWQLKTFTFLHILVLVWL